MTPTWNLTLPPRENGTALRCQAISKTPHSRAVRGDSRELDHRRGTPFWKPLWTAPAGELPARKKRLSLSQAGVRKQGGLLIPVAEAPGEGSGSSADDGFSPSAVELTGSRGVASIACVVPRPLGLEAYGSSLAARLVLLWSSRLDLFCILLAWCTSGLLPLSRAIQNLRSMPD
jgi:hypothetical protein